MAPRRAIDRSSADTSSQSSVTGGHLSHMPSSSHSTKKRQPIVRIVQVRPPKIISADLASFRDIVHRFTGHQAATCEEEEETGCTTKIIKSLQKAGKVSIIKGKSAISSAPSPSTSSAPASSPSSSSFSSSSSSDAESLHTNSPRRKSNEIRIARSSLEQDFQEYGSLLTSWDCITNDDTASKLMNVEGLMGSISNGMDGIYSALDSLTPFDHMVEFNKMNLNYYS